MLVRYLLPKMLKSTTVARRTMIRKYSAKANPVNHRGLILLSFLPLYVWNKHLYSFARVKIRRDSARSCWNCFPNGRIHRWFWLDRCDAHMNELPIPCGPWDPWYKDMQSYYNKVLGFGIAWFIFSLGMLIYTDSFYLNFSPPAQPGPPSDMVEECEDIDEK